MPIYKFAQMKPKHPQSRWCLAAKFLSALVAASLATFSAGATTVVGWGDSLTYGTGGITTTGEIRSWPWWFTQISGGLTVINKGVGGEPTSMIRTRMLAEPALHDNFTVIWAGRNNVGGFSTNMSYAEADIAEMVAALPPTTEYLVLGVTNSDSEPSGSTNLNNINLFNSHLAATYGPHFLDIRSILVESYDPSLPQDVINHAGDMPPASLLSDGLHLNPAGYEVVGAAIHKAFLTLAAPERGTWTGGGGTNNWKDSANWSVGPYSGNTDGFSSTETAFFETAGGGIIDLSGTVNVQTLAFGSRGEGAGAFTVGKSGDALNLTSGGGVSVGSLVSVDETVGNSAGTINLSDTANSTALFSNNGRSILTVASPINSTQGAGNTSTLNLGGYGDGIITGSINGGGAAGSDALSIVKNGTGTWMLSGQSSVSGTVGVLGGKLIIDGATNGTLISPVEISNGEASFKGDSSGATSVSLPNLVMGVRSATANTLTLASTGGTGVNLSVASYSNATSTIFSNLIDISSSPGNSVVIGSLGEGAFRPLSSGVLMSGPGSSSARAVTIVRDDGGYGFATISSTTNGALGRLATGTALGASNTSTTADYRLDGVGTLVRSANLKFSTLTINSSAGDIVLDMGAFTLNPTSYGCGVLIAGNHNVSINGSGVTTSRFYNYSTGTFSLSLASSTLLSIGGTGFTDYSGTIAPSTAGGVGIVIAQGIVRISRDQDLVVTAPTKFLATGGGVLEIGADLNGEAAGDFSYAINTSNFTKVIRFYGDSGLSASGGDRVVNFNGDATPKTYTWGSVHFLTDADGATDGGFTFKLSSERSDSTIEIQNPIVLGTNTNRCVDVANGSASIDAVLSGELKGTGASLIKNGGGTLSLRAKNIYSGATVINAGCLFIEGALSYTSAVDVASGAEVRVDGEVNLDCTTSVQGTLGGSGMMGTVVIESGGILSPGDLIAPLTADSVSFATGGVFSMEVEGASPGTSNQLSVVGNLNITPAALNLTVLTPLNDPVYILATYGSLTGTFASVTGLPAGYILDYAYNGGTQIALVATASTAPAAPTGLAASAVSSSQIDLSWTASSGATSYTVKRATTSGGPYTTIATGVTSTSYGDSGLAASTTYHYVVSAVNSVGESANSTQASATTQAAPTAPAAPTGLAASAVSSSQIDLSWTASSGATSYNVKRATTSGGPYTTIATGVTSTSYANTGLAASTTYHYVVSAVNSVGESANSAQASATTQAAPTAPAAPTGLAANAISSSQIDLSWTASNGATSYNVKRAATSGGPYTTIATGVTSTSYANSGLTASTTYHYVVSAVNSVGESANSAQASATTQAAPPAPAEGVLFEDDFSGGMTQWKRVGSATKPTLTTDNTTPLSGNVMLSSYAKVATVAYFPSITLQNPGDYIMARCDLRYASKQSTSTTGPTLALYDSKGTQLVADHTGAADGTLPASLTDDRGYKAYKSFETANDLILFHNHLGFAPLRFNALNPTLHSVGTGSTIALNTVYAMSLRIELAANGYDLVITSTFGGSSQTRTVAGTDVLTKTFDEIGVNLWGGDYSSSGVMDNVLVTTNRPIIPAGTTSSFHDNFDTGFTQWKRIGSATKPAIGTDNTSPLSGNVLQFNYAKVASVGYFKTVTLKWPGDYIQASYNVRYTAKQTTNTTGPTLALYNSQGTQLTADHTGAADGTLPASLTDDRGYKAYKSFETANDLILFHNHLGFAPLRFGSLNPSLNTVSTGTGIALNSVHTLALTIELAANGDDLLITSTFNGSTQTQTVTGADVLTKSFNEIGVNLWGGDFSGAGSLDNVVVFTNVNIPAGAAALGYTQVVIDERPKLADIAPGKTGNYKWFRGAVWTATQPPLGNFTETDGVLTILQQADGTTNSLVGAPHDFVGGVFPRLLGSEGFYIEFDVSLSTNDTDHWPAVWLMPAEHNGGNGQPLQDVYPNIYPNDPANYERWMELDVDEGGFAPGMLGNVISWEGEWNQPGGYDAVIANSYAAGAPALDRTQRHVFGASWDPVHQRVTWWLDGEKFYVADNTVTADCISPVAELQNFYPILGAQTHGPWKNPPTPAVPYSMFIHAVRAYMPE